MGMVLVLAELSVCLPHYVLGQLVYGTLPEPPALHTFNRALLLGNAGKKLCPVFSKEGLIRSIPCPTGFSGFHTAKIIFLDD